jgi:hypothetical protein
MHGILRDLPRDPVIDMRGPLRDFTVTLSDGRRVTGDGNRGEWSVCVYAPAAGRPLLGSGVGPTRLHALECAGLSGDDAGEVLGRAGI